MKFSFFTNKKYFFYRFALISGIGLILYDCYLRNNFRIIDNWGDLILLPIGCLLLGGILQGFLIVFADIYCKNKFFDFITKFENDDFDIWDLHQLAQILCNKDKIDGDTFDLITYMVFNKPVYSHLYVSQGDSSPPYNALSDETKRIEYLNNIINVVEKLKQK